MPQIEPFRSTSELQAATQSYYAAYAARKGADRNSLLNNPEVLFQNLAHDAAMVHALRSIHAGLQTARVLDVGCGDGGSLWLFLRAGFDPSNLFGVDIREDSIGKARAKNPKVNFQCDNATNLSYGDDAFDIAMETMMFLQLTDDEIAKRIASEMIRVTKPGGVLLISDWRYSKPGSKEFKGVSRKRIANLYQVGTQTRVRGTFRGALVPPVGRFLSKHLPSAYFALQKLLPFLTGHVVTVLEKRGTAAEAAR
jgi:SAM-dependent methyltransferase